MAYRVLEFRGINQNQLIMYFKELDAKQKTNSFPFIFEHATWSAEILSEEELSLTKTFKVNAVHIRFNADSDEILEELIKNYRYKTTRIGG